MTIATQEKSFAVFTNRKSSPTNALNNGSTINADEKKQKFSLHLDEIQRTKKLFLA